MAQAARYFHLHLISDSTGETLLMVARAAAAQYTKVMPIEHMHPLVRTSKQLDRIVIDVAARRLDLDVPAAELAARPAPPAGFAVDATGYLGIYRRDVQSMASGAVLTDLKP